MTIIAIEKHWGDDERLNAMASVILRHLIQCPRDHEVLAEEPRMVLARLRMTPAMVCMGSYTEQQLGVALRMACAMAAEGA